MTYVYGQGDRKEFLSLERAILFLEEKRKAIPNSHIIGQGNKILLVLKVRGEKDIILFTAYDNSRYEQGFRTGTMKNRKLNITGVMRK